MENRKISLLLFASRALFRSTNLHQKGLNHDTLITNAQTLPLSILYQPKAFLAIKASVLPLRRRQKKEGNFGFSCISALTGPTIARRGKNGAYRPPCERARANRMCGRLCARRLSVRGDKSI